MSFLQDADPGRYGVEPARPDAFDRLSLWVARSVSGRDGFYLALVLMLGWAGLGPYCRFDRWVTAFSLATSSVSFLLLFFIRHVQCRESKAVHLKLDELIYAAKNARNELISIEHLTEEQLDRLGRRYLRLAGHCQGVLVPPDGVPADA